MPDAAKEFQVNPYMSIPRVPPEDNRRFKYARCSLLPQPPAREGNKLQINLLLAPCLRPRAEQGVICARPARGAQVGELAVEVPPLAVRSSADGGKADPKKRGQCIYLVLGKGWGSFSHPC